MTDSYDHWAGEAAAIATARRLVSGAALPAGLRLGQVGASTAGDTFNQLDRLTQCCGVLLPSAAFLRGERLPARCLYAATPEGQIVAVAASVAENPAGSSLAGTAWWGMLATEAGWRGRGLAKWLGAACMLAMVDHHGIQAFGTGIRASNAASAKLCAGLGFANSGLVDLIAIDPATMSGGRLTA